MDLNKPSKNFDEAMSQVADWVESYPREYQEFIDCDALEVVPCPKGVQAPGSISRNEYKTKDDVLEKLKTRWCVRGGQAIEV